MARTRRTITIDEKIAEQKQIVSRAKAKYWLDIASPSEDSALKQICRYTLSQTDTQTCEVGVRHLGNLMS